VGVGHGVLLVSGDECDWSVVVDNHDLGTGRDVGQDLAELGADFAGELLDAAWLRHTSKLYDLYESCNVWISRVDDRYVNCR